MKMTVVQRLKIEPSHMFLKNLFVYILRTNILMIMLRFNSYSTNKTNLCLQKKIIIYMQCILRLRKLSATDYHHS
jgi:rRNA-processing protein FCF1